MSTLRFREMVGIKRIVDHVRASKKFGTDLDGVEQKNKN